MFSHFLTHRLLKPVVAIAVGLLFARGAVFADVSQNTQQADPPPPPEPPQKSRATNFFKNAFAAARRVLSAFFSSRSISQATSATSLAAVSANAGAVVISNAASAGAIDTNAVHTVAPPPPGETRG